ncbi:MAG: tRNA pseudouridine(38-40) synthase TruA [Clostridia bacterium]|nr:tRNA pseudouridine(38-40) synthase TruA [Clostridia bacterium]
MRRIRLILEYDGAAYVGWQRQQNALSVQQVVEEKLSRLTGETVTVTGASRTDAGVHALGQNAHFDTESRIPADKFSFALNTLLPPDIRAVSSSEVSSAFHARFSAMGKEYRYLFYAAPHASALYRNLSAHVIYPLDVPLMRAEAEAMLGRHDFAPFAASGSVVKDTVRTVDAVRVFENPPFVELRVHGNGFLYNMVRILAGTLIAVGTHKLEGGAIARALQSGSRLDLGVTAPPQGLTLMRVDYPEELCLPPM